VLAGFRFSATNLQDPGARLARTVALSTGVVLDAAVQHRLVDHLADGGSLLLTGRLPQRDQENRRCTVLANALGLSPAELVRGTNRFYPSLVGQGVASWMPETRVGWFERLESATAEPLFTDVDGRTCAVTADVGAGLAVVATTDLPSHPALFTAMLRWLGSTPGLRLRTSVPGVVVTTGASPRGERMLHVLNPTGHPATVQVDVGDPTGLLDQPLVLPARTGRMLGLGLELPSGETIVSSNAEVAELTNARIRFSPGLGERTEVWLRTDRRVTGPSTRTEGDLTVVTGPAGADLVVTFD
jgi:beta-galactosidase